MKLHELQQKRSAIALAMRQLHTEIGEKKWSDEQRTAWDMHQANFEQVDQQIEREEQLQSREKLEVTTELETRSEGTPDAEYRTAFGAFMRSGFSGMSVDEQRIFKEVRAQNSTSGGGKGGETIPREFRGLIVDKMKAYGGIANVCQVLETDAGNVMDWVVTDGTNDLGELVGENAETGEQDVSFTTDSLGAKKLTSKIIRVPNELLQDSGINFEAFLAARIASRIGRKEADLIVNGTGTGTPVQNKGLKVSTTVAQNAASASALSADDLLNLKHKIDPAYRMGAMFAFNDSTFLLLKKLKDAQGRPLWLPAIAGVAPSLIDGDRYVIDQGIESLGAAKVTAYYGDFNRFVLRRVRYMQLKRLTERYAEFDQTAFVAFHRFDTVLEDTSAMAKLLHP